MRCSARRSTVAIGASDSGVRTPGAFESVTDEHALDLPSSNGRGLGSSGCESTSRRTLRDVDTIEDARAVAGIAPRHPVRPGVCGDPA